MSTELILPPLELQALYPETDGEPMGASAAHIKWITAILGHLEAMYLHEPDVAVHGDMFWYPVRGNPGIRAAPDAMVIFGRPPALRTSYLQWIEGGIAPQAVFEVESPGNTAEDMEERYDFYDRYGVEEYYVYDFTRGRLHGYLRNADGALAPIPQMHGWVSPRLGVRFEFQGGELRLFRPDGTLFDMIGPALRERDEIKAERDEVKADRDEIKADRDHIQQERLKDKELIGRLVERLRRLGSDPDGDDSPAA